jgi:NADH-quinone oxidoreductase chain I
VGVRIKRSLPGLGLVRSAAISLRHVFEHKQTVQYPDEAPAVGFRFRGRHIFHQDVCIGCTQCERVCPVIAIKMETHKDPTSRKVVTDRFALDLGICYYCGLCEEVCPTDPKAVHLGPDFELATHDRRLLIYEMDQLIGPKPMPTRPPKPAVPPLAPAAAGGAAPAAAPAPAAADKAAGAPAAGTKAKPEEPAAPPAAEKPPSDKPAPAGEATKRGGEVAAVPEAPTAVAPDPHVVPVSKPETVEDEPVAKAQAASEAPAVTDETEPGAGLPDQPQGKPPASPAETVKPATEPEIVSEAPPGEEPKPEERA